MAKYHISPDGVARRCNAGSGENARGCHYGYSDEEHYTTKEDALKGAEQQLNKENGGSFGSVRKGNFSSVRKGNFGSDEEHYTTKEDAIKDEEQQLNKEYNGSFNKNNNTTELIEESKKLNNLSNINGVSQFKNNYDPINGYITFTKGKDISVNGLFRKKQIKSQENVKINIDDLKEVELLKDSNNLQRITKKQSIKSVFLRQEFEIPEIKNIAFEGVQELSNNLNSTISLFRYSEKRALRKGQNFKIVPLPNNGKNSSAREIRMHAYYNSRDSTEVEKYALTSDYVNMQVAAQQYYDFVEENKEQIFKAENEENYKILENINKHPESFNKLKKLEKTKEIKNPQLRKEARQLIGKELIQMNKEIEEYNNMVVEKKSQEKVIINEQNDFLDKQEKVIDDQNDERIMRELFD